jgi:hypothetical protein
MYCVLCNQETDGRDELCDKAPCPNGGARAAYL